MRNFSIQMLNLWALKPDFVISSFALFRFRRASLSRLSLKFSNFSTPVSNLWSRFAKRNLSSHNFNVTICNLLTTSLNLHK